MSGPLPACVTGAYDGAVNAFFAFAAEFWWLVFPLSGLWFAFGSSWSEATERRHRRKMEIYRLKHPGAAPAPIEQRREPSGKKSGKKTADRSRTDRAVRVVEAMHDDVDRRWLSYELDAAKLIDYPTMTDVREPLTVAFLRAKREADALRPQDAADLDAEDLVAYRAAVTSYGVAFQVAETEARRVRATGFTGEERARLDTARKLVTMAVDDAATAAERQAAYRRARRELDGLIVLPEATIDSLEQSVAGAIGPRRGSSPA